MGHGEAWGFRITDDNVKSVPELVRMLVEATGRNANLRLGVTPRQIPPSRLPRLRERGPRAEASPASLLAEPQDPKAVELVERGLNAGPVPGGRSLAVVIDTIEIRAPEGAGLRRNALQRL